MRASSYRNGKPEFIYQTPPIAVGADKLFFDLWNLSTSGYLLSIIGLWGIPKLDAAVTGALAIRGDLYRTSAIGTGGTAGVADSATRDEGGGAFQKLDPRQSALPSGITARVVPTGGATISRWLHSFNLAPEETNTSMGYIANDMNLIGLELRDKLIVPQDSGLLVKQGGIASVSLVAWRLAFRLIPA